MALPGGTSFWQCRRALPETSHSVPAAIDRPEHKAPQPETSKKSAATLRCLCQECAYCDFPRIYNLAEYGYFSQEPELSCTTLLFFLIIYFFFPLHFGRRITTSLWLMLCRKSSFKHSVVLFLSQEKNVIERAEQPEISLQNDTEVFIWHRKC